LSTICVIFKKESYAEEITKTGSRSPKNRIENKRQLRNRNEQISQIKLRNIDFEEVQRMNYLGAVIERNGGSKADVISTDTKIKMFNCTIKSVLLYGAETWIVDKNS
jgi:hypothetical protein